MTTARGFKVTDADRKTRVGIAVKTLEDLKKKTIEKFKLKQSPSMIDFQMTDGTLIETEEYFQTIPSQTLVIWVRKGEKAETDAEILYKTIREVNDEYLTAGEKVHEFFSEKMKNKVFKLAEVLRGLNGEKSKLSSKVDDPDWFEGLDTTAKTKEEYMFRRAQDRIRTYFYKTKEELMKNQELPYKSVHALMTELQTRLKINKYHGCYFDRGANNSRDDDLKSICDSSGTFQCQGRWDKPGCLYKPPHNINPYVSRETRIIFQTWNLDHQKERSRSIIPTICAALCDLKKSFMKYESSSRDVSDVILLDVESIYSDLFTTKNLKLVHIVCHDKGAHTSEKAGPYLLNEVKEMENVLYIRLVNDVQRPSIKAA